MSSNVTLTSGVTANTSLSKTTTKNNWKDMPLQLLTLLAAGGGLHILIGRETRACQLREKDGGRVPLDMMEGGREGQQHGNSL
jgi:hypothetical protein